MHPFGFFLAIVANGTERTRARRRVPEEPLPPINDATVRAWRAWARDEGSGGFPGSDERRSAPAQSTISTATPADRPA